MSEVNNRHPPSLLQPTQALTFVCPLCKGELQVREETYHCEHCERTYPLHAGIPDFRVFEDPYLDFEADRVRTEIVLAALETVSFEALLELYWSHSDITPPELRAKFIRNAVLGENRGRRMLRVIENESAARSASNQRILEIGSGTGNFLVVAGPRCRQVVGVDIAMRWLHACRRRFIERGIPPSPLVCCCAEYLPFPQGSFDLVVCWSTLEFTREPERLIAESARVLIPMGSMYLNTANRYTIAKDPYSYLWGVGFLPRSWQARYVHWRTKASYGPVRTVSQPELRRFARRYFKRIEIALPDIDNESLNRLPVSARAQVAVYRALKCLPVVRRLLRWVAPQWDVRLSEPALNRG